MTNYSDRFFRTLGIAPNETGRVKGLARDTAIPLERLRYYNDQNKIPTGNDLQCLLSVCGITEERLRLAMSRPNRRLLNSLADRELGTSSPAVETTQQPLDTPALRTDFGVLYQGDCLEVLPSLDNESVDVVFADPPFNLNKLYPSKIDDDLREQQYLEWCERWIGELVRILKWGGSLFLWNLPRWNFLLAEMLEQHLTFRHWISVDMKFSLPISGRLYPSHYSLLYFCKGPRPRVFHPDRLPMEICPSCMTDLRDYGGYKDRMNPRGVNLTDVWWDIPPVRHAKYKNRSGANELSVRLLDRILELSSDPGDVVLDPFGGSGTSYAVAEIKERSWIGMEIGDVSDIRERMTDLTVERERINDIRADLNALFTPRARAKREQLGMWTAESVRRASEG